MFMRTLFLDEVLVVSSDRLSHAQAHAPDFMVKRLEGVENADSDLSWLCLPSCDSGDI